MTCVAQNTKNMIIYLLVGCLFQMGNIHTTPVPAEDQNAAASTPSSTASSALDKANSMVTDGAKTAINGVENVGDMFKTLIKKTGSAVSDLGSEANKSLGEIAKGGGRSTLALGYLFSQLFDGLSATVATGGGYLASGFRNIDDVVGDWPVVGLVTGTLDAVSTHVSNAVTEMSENGRNSRQKMFEGLRGHLNRSGSSLPNAENEVTSDANSDAVV
ncbi:uncharacterized protein LOC111033127 [Myzus persicae]|uniref:uncharacterized protein LOC111033127 n=1 Tax=Myzus persicae TaxID=13164 RepID=UPI000B9376A6|nr:uncharacterized protein LOC111033127 [Myzus persicae]